MAKLTAVYGPMFAGKTTWIIQKVNELEKQGERCLVVKPRLDNRYGKEAMLHAHSGLTGQAVLVDENNPQEILGVWTEMFEQHKVVVIDEAMFFPNQIIEVVKEMMARELHVIVAGLDTNYRREPFGPMPSLIRLANETQVLTSKCYKCDGIAEYTVRLGGGSSDIEVGAQDTYQPACLKCHAIYEKKTKANGLSEAFVFPNLRPVKTKVKTIRIEVGADSMRVGKTTAVKVIAAGLRKRGLSVSESFEDWQHNPYLQKSYEDPAKNFLESQKWFARRKHEQIAESFAKSASEKNHIFIQDVSPETDYAYAVTNLRLGRMSQEHFTKYDEYYRSLDWSVAPKPDVLIYLEVSDNELLKRAESSRREFETVEPSYFLTMKQVNREWLEGAKVNGEYRILNIDTDKLDFANNERDMEELVEKVAKLI